MPITQHTTNKWISNAVSNQKRNLKHDQDTNNEIQELVLLP